MNRVNDSSDELFEQFQKYEYEQDSVLYPTKSLLNPIEIYKLFSSLPLSVTDFLSRLNERNDRWVSFEDLFYKRISDDEQSLKNYYDLMDVRERACFLMFHTIDVHEFTHHIDFLTTPFGEYYHEKLCLEYIAFQQFIPELLKHSEIIPDLYAMMIFYHPNL